MKYFNCPMSSSLFSSFQENTKCESHFFADTCTLSVPILSKYLKRYPAPANAKALNSPPATVLAIVYVYLDLNGSSGRYFFSFRYETSKDDKLTETANLTNPFTFSGVPRGSFKNFFDAIDIPTAPAVSSTASYTSFAIFPSVLILLYYMLCLMSHSKVSMVDLSGCFSIDTVGGVYLGSSAFSSLLFILYVMTRVISAMASPT